MSESAHLITEMKWKHGNISNHDVIWDILNDYGYRSDGGYFEITVKDMKVLLSNHPEIPEVERSYIEIDIAYIEKIGCLSGNIDIKNDVESNNEWMRYWIY